jgi:hypothetical protein
MEKEVEAAIMMAQKLEETGATRNNGLNAYLSSYLEAAFRAAVWACVSENGQ